jgi:hypothetical protein
MEGLQNNNSKPFWKYAKSLKQDNIGVSPLKGNGQLVNDSKRKADILVNQFKSIFTREENKTLPKTTKHISRSIPDLERLPVVILQSFHYSVIYVIPFCFSYLAFTFFLEVFVVCPFVGFLSLVV